jgi:hypothetical protein
VLATAALCFACAAVAETGLPDTSNVAARPRASEARIVGRVVRALDRGWAAIGSEPELRLVAELFAAKNEAIRAVAIVVGSALTAAIVELVGTRRRWSPPGSCWSRPPGPVSSSGLVSARASRGRSTCG